MIIDEIIIGKRQQKNFKIGGFVQVCKTNTPFFKIKELMTTGVSCLLE